MYVPRPLLAALSHAVLPPLMAAQVVFGSSLAEQLSGVVTFAAFCMFFQTMLPRTPPWDRWIIFVSACAIACRLLTQVEMPNGTWSDATVGLLIGVPVGVFCVAVVLKRPRGQAELRLHSPVSGGRFLIVQGGASRFVNHHLKCLQIPSLRGQSYGVDIVAAGRFGLQTRNLWPRHINDFWIFGHPLGSPVEGQVSAASDGAEDQPLGGADREAPMGNYVCIQCDDPEFGRIEVCMAHLRKGSVSVTKGDFVRSGQPLGAIGNSGNSSDPHLHIHVHLPDSSGDPLVGKPILFLFPGMGNIRRNRVFTVPD